MRLHILMPFYGDEKLLREAVESVLRQSSSDWMLTVIDDANPDPGPGRWVASLAEPRVSYLRNNKNTGVSAVFRQAAGLAQADLVTIMGCDDRLLPNYTDVAIDTMRAAPHASYLQPGVSVIDEHGRRVRPLADVIKRMLRPRHGTTSIEGERAVQSLLRGNWTYFPSIVWRREVLERHRFRDDLEVALDLQLQLEILWDGGTMALSDETTFLYRRHSKSVSAVTARDGLRFAEEKRLFAEWAARSRQRGWTAAARAADQHITSRFNALLIALLTTTDGGMRRHLMTHALERRAPQ